MTGSKQYHHHPPGLKLALVLVGFLIIGSGCSRSYRSEAEHSGQSAGSIAIAPENAAQPPLVDGLRSPSGRLVGAILVIQGERATQKKAASSSGRSFFRLSI